MKSTFEKINKYVPVIPMVLFALLPVAALVHVIGAFSPRFADFFNIHIASIFRMGKSYRVAAFFAR